MSSSKHSSAKSEREMLTDIDEGIEGTEVALRRISNPLGDAKGATTASFSSNFARCIRASEIIMLGNELEARTVAAAAPFFSTLPPVELERSP